MGYTHYFPQTQEISEREFTRIGVYLRAILNSEDPRLPKVAYEMNVPETPPAIETDLIRFNGILDEGHETFYLPRVHKPQTYEVGGRFGTYGFNFCKTARKPYDILVCATLLLCDYVREGWLDIGSDGEEEDWQDAQELVKDVLGLKIPVPKGVVRED